jgi:NAD+ kinase
VLSVSPPLGEARALFDLTLVSEEPARISEFTVRSGTDTVDCFRADGVVVATPAGSGDYARAAGGPVVGRGTGVVAVVPISPFATDTDHWVLDAASVVLRVERDDNPVELLVDGRSEGRVVPGEGLRIAPESELTLAAVSGRRTDFGW